MKSERPLEDLKEVIKKMSDVKWIKITTDIFDPDSKLFAIESMTDGYLLELVWFKLLVLTGKLNNSGMLVNSAKIPYTDEMLSQAFRIELGTIQRAIDLFEKLEMIEVVDNAYMISNWLAYQSGDRLEEMREKHRISQQKYREKQKMQLDEKDGDITRDVTCDVIPSISISNSSSLSLSDSYKEIIDYLNSITGKKFKVGTADTKKHIKARLSEGFTIDDFKAVIDKKYAEWHADPKMSQYLRPQTLFGTKFESYLNQQDVAPKSRLEEVDSWV